MLFTASTALSVSASSALTSFLVGSGRAVQASSGCAVCELEPGGLRRRPALSSCRRGSAGSGWSEKNQKCDVSTATSSSTRRPRHPLLVTRARNEKIAVPPKGDKCPACTEGARLRSGGFDGLCRRDKEAPFSTA